MRASRSQIEGLASRLRDGGYVKAARQLGAHLRTVTGEGYGLPIVVTDGRHTLVVKPWGSELAAWLGDRPVATATATIEERPATPRGQPTKDPADLRQTLSMRVDPRIRARMEARARAIGEPVTRVWEQAAEAWLDATDAR